MNNYSYEEYMKNLLGNNIYNQRKINVNTVELYDDNTYNNQENSELEKCYPDIYKIIYPMICKRCLYINEEITEELVERITTEIYENVEKDEYPEEARSEQIKAIYRNGRSNKNMRYMYRINEENNQLEEKRQKNLLLNDLIKILVLRELLGTGRRTRISNYNNKLSMPIKF